MKSGKIYIVILIITGILTLGLEGYAQDGKIIRQRSFKPDKTLIQELNAENPGAEFTDTFALAEMSEITYLSDGYKIKGFMVRPVKEGKYPCLIYNRDGYVNFNALNEITVARELHKFARWGYIVVASQLRGTADGEGREEYGGSEVNDILNLIPLLGKIPGADTTRIGMFGKNRGGMMTYLALKKTSRIDAAIVSSGIANVFLFAAENLEYYNVLNDLIPDYPEHRVVPIKERSMVFWPGDICKTTPILIVQGSADKFVHPTQSMTAFEELFKVLQPARLVIYEGGDNNFSEHKDEYNELLEEWLNKYVRDLERVPDINLH